MNKKIFFIIFFSFFFFSMNVSAKTKFLVESKTFSLGESIPIEIYMIDNPGFGILSMKVKYDSEYLEYVSYEIIGLDGATLTGVELDRNGDISFYALSVQSLLKSVKDTPILILNFKDKGKTGTTNVALEIQNYAYDETLNLDYEVENGTVFIQEVEHITKEDNTSLKDEVPAEIRKEDTKWSTSDHSIATVDEQGNVTFHKNGSVTITAVQDGEEVYKKNYEVEIPKEGTVAKDIKEEKKISKKKSILPLFFGFLVFLLVLISVFFHRKKRRRIGK